MPFLFPSHPGLVAPLWRRWPGHFDALALCIGAMMPDLVDGLLGITQGRLGQGLGHSLLGSALVCVPIGLLLYAGVRAAAARIPRRSEGHGVWAAFLAFLQGAPTVGAAGLALSMGIGVLSHVLSDLLSHDGGPLFYPGPRWHPYPAWWSEPWFFMPVPGYPDGYPFAPHFLAWLAITLLGAWLLVAPTVRRARTQAPPQRPAPDRRR